MKLENKLNRETVLIFALILSGLMIFQVMLPDMMTSISERRTLAEMPEFTTERFLSGEFTAELETYFLEQFPLRESFRHLKARVELEVFYKMDINDIYIYDDYLVKLSSPYNADSVEGFTNYLNAVQAMYLGEQNVFVTMIPDKNYFTELGGYPQLDYEAMETNLKTNLDEMTYIDLMTVLTLEDYYKTDTHWRQDQLFPVLKTFHDEMAFETDFSKINYTTQIFEEFYGVYYGQATLDLTPDILTYLISPSMKAVTITNYENLELTDLKVYDIEKLEGMDAYDVFLSGASPLIILERTDAVVEKELLLFRDSFGSSLAPLLLDEYSKITMIDTRYMSYEYLGQFVDFENADDVLFMYNTEVINNSAMLK